MDLSLGRRHSFQQFNLEMVADWSATPLQNASGGNLSFMTGGGATTASRNLTAVLMFVLVTVATRLLMMQEKRKIRLPGPTPLPLLGNAHLLVGDTSKLLYKISDLLEQYDGFMSLWIGPKLHVFVSKPEHLEVFCTNPKLQDKSEHYKFIKPLLGESVFTSNGSTWKQGRKMLMPPLRPTFLKNMMPNFNGHTKTLIDIIQREAGNGTFDVFPYVRNCAFGMIFETVMGRQIACQTEPIRALDVTEEVMDLIYQRALKLWLQWDPLFYLLPDGKRFKAGVEFLNQFNATQIRTSMQLLANGEISGGLDGQLLVKHLSERLNSKEDFDVLREHVQTMLVTGYDTTAGTMGFICMMLGIHQDVQQKVYEEISRVTLALNGRDLSAEDLHDLEYLDRVIKETLRLFPVGPLLFREATDDVMIGEHLIPKGAAVASVMLRTHRDPNIFSNPLKFDPDNFLPERMQGRHPYAYIPFSAGSRGCIGTKYGMMSMKVIVSQLIANYQVFCDIKMDDIRLKPEITMKIEGGFQVRIEKRS